MAFPHQDGAALPKTHRALVCKSRDEPLEVQKLPTPQPGPGSVVVRIIVSNILPYHREIYNGVRPYPFPLPFVTGCSSIGRVAAVGPDTVSLTVGQLVVADGFIGGRDDATERFLSGIHEGHGPGSKKLMHGEWRDSAFAEYCKVPLENCFAINEGRLLGKGDGGLGYSVEDLAFVPRLLIPFGGLLDMGVKAGETIIVAPATGSFGQAAVAVAEAMGARVIAAGRNLDALKKIAARSDRIEFVQLKGDVMGDAEELKKFGAVDGYIDFSPPWAAQSTHIKSCILALRHGGRVDLMGGIREDIAFPYSAFMHANLKMFGTWMYERNAVPLLLKMIEVGVLKVGPRADMTTVGKFPIEDWDKAFSAARDTPGVVTQALLAP